jgi:uncharacterized membrane protein YkvA (DUF1232 family)
MNAEFSTRSWSEPAESEPKRSWLPTNYRPLLVVVLCVVYIISPIDLLPEAFLGPLGLIDDLGALFVAIAAFKKAYRSA